jgi:hypothetical protein
MSNLQPLDPVELAEWLDRDVEGDLEPSQRARLAALSATTPELAVERAQLERLRSLLAAGQISVEPTFSLRVMAGLPAAGWEARHPRFWLGPAFLAALLAAAAATFVGVSSARLEPGVPFVAAFGAVLALLGKSLLAGAGLLGASWRGVGMTVGRFLSASPANLAAATVAVVCLDLLLVQLLRGRKTAAATAPSGRGR